VSDEHQDPRAQLATGVLQLILETQPQTADGITTCDPTDVLAALALVSGDIIAAHPERVRSKLYSIYARGIRKQTRKRAGRTMFKVAPTQSGRG
jgi:hypothetical protein